MSMAASEVRGRSGRLTVFADRNPSVGLGLWQEGHALNGERLATANSE